jgi:2-polyprenyl-3-methyl-5-hydroxy-6-metoxy-1,4-benzoquinol methylase
MVILQIIGNAPPEEHLPAGLLSTARYVIILKRPISGMKNGIELISTEILNERAALSRELIHLGKTLALSSGWHYPLDWTWTIQAMGDFSGKTILDAGAGIGLLQWFLASRGGNVISVDRSERTCIPFHLSQKYGVTGYRREDTPLNPKELLDIRNGKASFSARFKALARGVAGSILSRTQPMGTGSVRMLKQDLRRISEVADNSVDMVVSISALEHNESIANIKEIIRELERTLVPGGIMLITLPASRDRDWFFPEAYSWCFTEATLRDLFGFPANIPANYTEYDALFEKLLNSSVLRRNLSWRYFFRGNTGMPGGKWDPKYLPVGIIKTKQA